MANPEHLAILKQGVAAWNRWRKERGDIRPDLSRANLANAALWEANLRSCILERTNMSGAKLAAARFWGSRLKGAVLNGADLSCADFSNSDLSAVSLQRALVGSAYFRDATIEGCRFHGARTSRTAFINLDLCIAAGLDEVCHFHPSSVDNGTLHRSAQGLSRNPANQGAVETFLRGVGVAEHMIEYFRSLIGKPIEFYSCFISYSHADKVFARRLHDLLQARGIRCWLDEHQLLPGDPIMQSVDNGIRLWDKVLLCCSEAALSSWWVKDEIKKAIQKERKLEKQRGNEVYSIVPLDLDGYLLSDEYRSEFESVLKERVAADFTGWEHDNDKFDDQFEKVMKALRTEREEPPEARL